MTLARAIASLVAVLSGLAGWPMIAIPAETEPALTEPPPAPPNRTLPNETRWLDQQWNPEQRAWYHHTPQGTATFVVPYEWFVALEQPQLSPELLSNPDYLDRFGFIRSPSDSKYNPDGLPVGFGHGGEAIDPTTGETSRNPATGKPFTAVGLTCAACHTGQIDYHGVRVVIDGGPALIDLARFGKALQASIARTVVPTVFHRFAGRVLGQDHGLRAEVALRKQFDHVFAEGSAASLLDALKAHDSVDEGFGRLDALNRIGNEVFANRLDDPDNYEPRTAPVAYPHIWDTPWFDWVQYNGSIEQPMVRNAGEALGVRALVNFTSHEQPMLASTINFENLARMEALLAGDPTPPGGPQAVSHFPGLKAPAWPEDVLPPIDRQLAEGQGRALYQELCMGCHRPPVTTPAFWDAKHWSEPNAAGLRYLKMPMIDIAEIGTDPEQARGMKERTVMVPADLGLTNGTGTGPVLTYSYGPALGEIVEKTITAWYGSQTPPVPAELRDKMNGFRPNGIRAPLAYKARPLDGVWATPPFLHNGSVPNLYALLSPVTERPTKFFLGSREFDPVLVGYETAPIPGGFELDTTEKGNSNGGHVFDDGPKGAGIIGRRLSPDERKALIEYLKTL